GKGVDVGKLHVGGVEPPPPAVELHENALVPADDRDRIVPARAVDFDRPRIRVVEDRARPGRQQRPRLEKLDHGPFLPCTPNDARTDAKHTAPLVHFSGLCRLVPPVSAKSLCGESDTPVRHGSTYSSG